MTKFWKKEVTDVTLKRVMEIEENKLSKEDLDMSWLSYEEKLYRWRDNINKSVKDRSEYIAKVQNNNKRLRLMLLHWTNDEEWWDNLIARCEEDPLFFFNMFLWTYNPRLKESNIPFITYPYQDRFILEVVEAVEKWVDIWVEKSRDMWLSWVMLWIFVWWFLFKEWSILIWSYKEDYVDSQWNMDSAFERMRYMLWRLPKEMKPYWLLNKYMNISVPNELNWWDRKRWMTGMKAIAEWWLKKKVWEISWDVWVNFGTWWRRKVVFLDEFALRPRDETALQKTKDVTECRIFWWTPNGTGNVYWKVMTNHKSYRHLLNKKVKLIWKEHPLKSEVWYEYQKLTRTSVDLAQEVDISYETSVVNAVYPLFLQMTTKWTYIYDVNRQTYGSWDFGRDSIAFCLWQKDFYSWNIYLIKSFRRVNWNIKDFAGLVLWKPYQWNWWVYDERDYKIMKYMKMIRFNDHFWDPYNSDQKTVVTEDSIRKALAEMWISLTTNRKSTVRERITKTQLWLNRLYYDKDNYEWEQSMIQSHYKKVSENSYQTTESRLPVHDDNSHYRTCTEYFFDNEPLNVWMDWWLIVNNWLLK